MQTQISRWGNSLAVTGVVLADRLKSIDRHARDIEVVGKAPPGIVAEVRNRLWPLLAE
jgi:antitoxin component of MazEF toxin-antitoxin module